MQVTGAMQSSYGQPEALRGSVLVSRVLVSVRPRLYCVWSHTVRGHTLANEGTVRMQAKRTNIGIAMITNPRVLFLDEPTSGLDSYTAHEVRRSARAPHQHQDLLSCMQTGSSA